MKTLTRALAMLALAALLVGLLAAAVVAQSDHVDYKALTIVIALGIAARVDRHRPLRLVAPPGATGSAR